MSANFSQLCRMNFGSTIIRWYHVNKRDLPWRNSNNPYFIWLSEIILQQTRVDQGMSYYYKFIQKYPTIEKLASAKEDDVLKLWQGLGYYSRARNLHHTAKEIVKKHNGKFPDDENLLLSLKGIGDYTAGAILSFAFHKKFPVVDGNVYRLLSRYFGIVTPIDSPKAKKEFFLLAGELMENHPPSDFNQGIMEFGSRQCKPQNPDCIACPLVSTCIAFAEKKVNQLPVKNKKSAIRNRYFSYLVIQQKGKLLINKRSKKDIWQNLHDFPLIETSKKISKKRIMSCPEWKALFGKSNAKVISVSSEHKHLLSHQTIHAKFYHVHLEDKKILMKENDFMLVSEQAIKKYAVPKLIENFLKKEFD